MPFTPLDSAGSDINIESLTPTETPVLNSSFIPTTPSETDTAIPQKRGIVGNLNDVIFYTAFGPLGVAAKKSSPIISSVAKEIARPFVKLGVTGAVAGGATLASAQEKLLGVKGGQQQAEQLLEQGINLPFYGQVQPAKIGTDIEKGGGFGRETLKTFGTGAQIATTLAPIKAYGLGWSEIGKAGLYGFTKGSLYGFGTSIQDDSKPLEQVGLDALLSGILASAIETTGPIYQTIKKGLAGEIRPPATVDLTRAIKPSNRNTKFKDDIGVVVNELKDKKITSAADMISALDEQKKSIWKKVAESQKKIPTINGDQIADDIIALADDPVIRRENPQLIEQFKARAEQYRGKIPTEEAELILQAANARLKAFYNKAKTDQSTAIKAYPEIKADLALADGIRKQFDFALDGFSDLKRTYGALSNIQSELNKRIPVAERAQQLSLAEQISFAQAFGQSLKDLANLQVGSSIAGLSQAAVAKFIKNRLTLDSTIKRAFETARLGKKLTPATFKAFQSILEVPAINILFGE